MKYFILIALWLGCLSSTTTIYATHNEISTIDVITDTFKGTSNCLHYKVVGMCFWFRCQLSGCGIETTLKLDHYLPDIVISVYTQPDNNPWDFAKVTIDPIAYQAGKAEVKSATHFNMADGHSHENSSRDVNNHFHEVDVIGNPALLIFNQLGVLLLPGATTIFMPYYTSLLDAYAWRFPALEQFYPGSMVPGLNEVGTLILHDWGPIYPRNGYVNQPDDAKAAAVVAQRAADIATKMGQPHVYQPLSSKCGDHCDVDSAKENSAQTQYQMIYPKVDNQCLVFGKSDITSLQPWGADAAKAGNNRYIWVMWRHYHGCVPLSDGTYLASIDF